MLRTFRKQLKRVTFESGDSFIQELRTACQSRDGAEVLGIDLSGNDDVPVSKLADMADFLGLDLRASLTEWVRKRGYSKDIISQDEQDLLDKLEKMRVKGQLPKLIRIINAISDETWYPFSMEYAAQRRMAIAWYVRAKEYESVLARLDQMKEIDRPFADALSSGSTGLHSTVDYITKTQWVTHVPIKWLLCIDESRSFYGYTPEVENLVPRILLLTKSQSELLELGGEGND